MQHEPVRMGYVGAGFLAQNVHLPNFSTLSGSHLLALAELRPDLARLVAHKYGIPKTYRTHLELAADPEIEAVGISAHYAQQGEIAADLLEAGKHVFLEKPMAISVAQGERILAASKKGNARLMIAYMKRYDPGNMLARETIAGWQADGSKGKLLYVRNHGFCGNWISRLDTRQTIGTNEPMAPVETQQHLPSWLPPEKAEHYLSYLQQYTHNVNFLRYIVGAGDQAQVESVSLDSDGLTGLVVLNVGGVRCTIESASTSYHDWDEHTQVYFEHGWVRIVSPPFFAAPSQSHIEIYEGGATPGYRNPIAQPLLAWSYREEAAFFLQALRTGEAFRSSAEDTLTDVRLLEEVYRAFCYSRHDK